jgi:C4-dicarboxylate-specific signal transduction histidine kinase
VASGKSIAYYIIFRDVTESKRALEELQKAQAELAHLSRITTMGELAASIAHEMNQPIGAIATNGNAAARWLGQQPPDLVGAGEALECIVRDANRAAQVIGRIRSLLKKNPTPMVRLDVNDIIQEVLLLTAYETSRRHVAVMTQLESRLPAILGDRVQLQQVMLNLIMNSLDAMSAITDRIGQACRFRQISHGAAQSALCRHWFCNALGGLVRIQCGISSGRKWFGVKCVHGNTYRSFVGSIGLDDC